MMLNITEDICSITDLRRNTHSVLDQIHKTKRPVVLTVNGKAEAVIFDADLYFSDFADTSDISQEINRDDIFTFWSVISGIIRVKMSPVSISTGQLPSKKT